MPDPLTTSPEPPPRKANRGPFKAYNDRVDAYMAPRLEKERQQRAEAKVKNAANREAMKEEWANTKPAPKSLSIAILLWFFLGIFGAHRFYLGYWRSGLLWLFTLGFLGVGWIIDMLRVAVLYERRMGDDWKM